MRKADFEREVNRAIGSLAKEFYYFKELKEDLDALKKDLESAKKRVELRDIRRAFRDFRYVSRAERRFNSSEKHIEELLKSAKERIVVSGTVEEVEQLIRWLHTEAANLVHDASSFDSEIKDHLVMIRDEIKDDEPEKAQAALMELEGCISECEKWIAALSVSLKKAKRLAGRFQSEGMGIEQIEERLISLSPKEQTAYLGRILLKRNLIRSKTIKNINKKIMQLAEEYALFGEAAEAYEKAGMEKEKNAAYKLWGDHEFKAGRYYSAVGIYKKAEITDKKFWERCAERCLDERSYKSAIESYQFAGQWEKGRLIAARKYLEDAAENRYDIPRLTQIARETVRPLLMPSSNKKYQVKALELIGDSFVMEAKKGYKWEDSLREAYKRYKEAGESKKMKGVIHIFLDKHLTPVSIKNFPLLREITSGLNELELWQKVGEYCEDRGNFLIAGLAFSKSKEYEKAAKYYLKAERYNLAGEEYEKAGKYDLAVRAYEKIDNLPARAQYVAELYKKIRKPKKLAEFYGKNKMWKEAGEVYEEMGLDEDAAQAYEKGGEWGKAAASWNKAGKRSKAMSARRKVNKGR